MSQTFLHKTFNSSLMKILDLIFCPKSIKEDIVVCLFDYLILSEYLPLFGDSSFCSILLFFSVQFTYQDWFDFSPPVRCACFRNEKKQIQRSKGRQINHMMGRKLSISGVKKRKHRAQTQNYAPVLSWDYSQDSLPYAQPKFQKVNWRMKIVIKVLLYSG